MWCPARPNPIRFSVLENKCTSEEGERKVSVPSSCISCREHHLGRSALKHASFMGREAGCAPHWPCPAGSSPPLVSSPLLNPSSLLCPASTVLGYSVPPSRGLLRSSQGVSTFLKNNSLGSNPSLLPPNSTKAPDRHPQSCFSASSFTPDVSLCLPRPHQAAPGAASQPCAGPAQALRKQSPGKLLC